MNLFKTNRLIHRDLGYLFFAMCIIYGISGIAFNHINSWNPNYIITNDTVMATELQNTYPEKVDLDKFLTRIGEAGNYKKHYFPSKNEMKIFINSGSIQVDLHTGLAIIEKIQRRPFFYQINYLHYNNAHRWWTVYSDLFAVGLVLLAISGLFMVKGKKGITGRGALYLVAGILIPVILFFIYS